MHAYRSHRESHIPSTVLKLHSTWSAFCFAVAMGLAAAVLLPATRAEAFACDESIEGQSCTTVGGCQGYLTCMGTKPVCEAVNYTPACDVPPQTCGNGVCDNKETACGCPGDCKAFEANLINRYAPVWRFQAGDNYLPTSIDAFLAHSEMVLRDGGTVAALPGLGAGQVSRWNLSTQRWSWNGYTYESWRVNSGPATFGLRKAASAPSNFDRGDINAAKIYVQAGTYLDTNPILQYWIFYPYSNNSPAGAHEGDWEHVTVVFGYGKSNPPTAVWYAQHGGNQSVPWNNVSRVPYAGDQIYAFVANGDHATYPWQLDSTSYPSWAPQLNTLNRWEYFGDANGCISTNGWGRFWGRWGNSYNGIADSWGNSPMTPYYQYSWMKQ